MRFVHITGFPRTGTTWLHHTIRSAPQCAGVDEEQGFDRISAFCQSLEAVDDDEIARQFWALKPGRSEVRETFWLGIFLRKNWRSHRWQLFDRIVAGDIRPHHTCYVHKLPTFDFPGSFADDYALQSTVFRDATTICMWRDPREAYKSGLRRFPHWRDEGVSWEHYQEMWKSFYDRAAEQPNYHWFEHADRKSVV